VQVVSLQVVVLLEELRMEESECGELRDGLRLEVVKELKHT
jgi:hypothetical protein